MLEAMINQGVAVEAAGRQITIRRLNVRDVFRFAGILAKAGNLVADAISKYQQQLSQATGKNEYGAQTTNEQSNQPYAYNLGIAIISTIPYCEDEAIDFFASITGMGKEEFAALPPHVLPAVIGALIMHEDFKAFFNAAAKAAKATKPMLSEQ